MVSCEDMHSEFGKIYIYLKIDDVQQVCDKLDSLGKSEHIFEDCRNRVFSE